MKVFLFGPPRFMLNGNEIELKRRKATALLAYLILNDSCQPRDTLADLLWPDKPTSRANLRRELYVLRDSFREAVIQADEERIWLNPEVELWVDILMVYSVLIRL